MTFRLIKGLFRVCIEMKKSFCEFFAKIFSFFRLSFEIFVLIVKFRFNLFFKKMQNFRNIRNAKISRKKYNIMKKFEIYKKAKFLRKFIKKRKIQLEFVWFLWNFSRNFASLSYFSLHSFSRKNAKFREKAMMTFPTLFIGFFIH